MRRAAIVLVAVLGGCSGDGGGLTFFVSGASWEIEQSNDWDAVVVVTASVYTPEVGEDFEDPDYEPARLIGSASTTTHSARYQDGNASWPEEAIELPLVEHSTIHLAARDETTDRRLAFCEYDATWGGTFEEEPPCPWVDLRVEVADHPDSPPFE